MDPSQLLGSSSLSTGDATLDALLQSQFRSSGPAAGSGFSPGSMAADRHLIRSPRPLLQAAPALGVVVSPDRWRRCLRNCDQWRAGRRCSADIGAAPASAGVGPGVSRKPSGAYVATRRSPWRGSLGSSVIAAPALQGPNAFGGDVNKPMAAAKASDDADRNQFWKFWQHPLGYTNPLATQNAPPTAPRRLIRASVSATGPPTLTRAQRQRIPPSADNQFFSAAASGPPAAICPRSDSSCECRSTTPPSAPALRTLAMAFRKRRRLIQAPHSSIQHVHHHRPAQRRHGRRAKLCWPACAAIFQSGARAWRPGADGRARSLRPVQSSSRGAGRRCASDGAGRGARPRARPALGPGADRSSADDAGFANGYPHIGSTAPSKDIYGNPAMGKSSNVQM